MSAFNFYDPSSWGVEDDNSCRAACDAQVAVFGKFLEEYEEKLDSLSSGCDYVWDPCLHPVSFELTVDDVTAAAESVPEISGDPVRKIVLVFTHLCDEMKSLIAEAENSFFDVLCLYGEEGEPGIDEGNTEMMIGKFVAVLPELDAFVRRCRVVLNSCVLQLSAAFDPKAPVDVSNVHLVHVLQCFGGVLSTLYTLDEIIKLQPHILKHWITYKRLLKNVRREPNEFKVDNAKMSALIDLLRNLEDVLLSDKIFVDSLADCSDTARVSEAGTKSKNHFAAEWKECLTLWVDQLDAQVGQTYELDRRLGQQLMALACCFVFYTSVVQGLDKKLVKQIWELQKKIPVVLLHAQHVWILDDFFVQHLGGFASVIDRRAMSSSAAFRSNYVQQKTASIGRDEVAYGVQVCTWTAKFEELSKLEPSKLRIEDMKRFANLFIQGILYAHRLSFTAKLILNVHARFVKPMSKVDIACVCRLIELLQSIRATYHRHGMLVAEITGYVMQHLSFVALTTLAGVKKRLLNEKPSSRRSDILTALVLTEHALNGPVTKVKRLVAIIAMAFARCSKTLTEGEFQALEKNLRKMEFLCDLGSSLEKACDGSFLYWHRVIIPIYFDDVLSCETNPHRIHEFFSALEDCIAPLSHCRHVQSDALSDRFCAEVMDALERQILLPLCNKIEVDLRLQTHCHLQLEERNPFSAPVADLSDFLRLRPLALGKFTLHVKKYVEDYLDKTFYTLTTIALHDWKTYGEMRSIARLKYGAETREAHLPSQTLEQGLDVLEIMRNLHIFVGKFAYNLNTQTFIEVSSNNKHLESIGIRHVANSIRTHGPGIMNTTVNITYQFLKKKFQIFSQFLFDDHIKSRLMKDVRYFKENKDSLGQKYPYDRAEDFNRGIRRLGLTPDGQTYLDKFRVLITQIGNAMGFVRMIRSGGLHSCGKAASFIPDLDTYGISVDNSDLLTNVGFKEMVEQAELSAETKEAGSSVDSVVAEICKRFTRGTQYFRLLVQVLGPVFRDGKHGHLKNFFIIIPPLTVNFVEHFIASQEMMLKRNCDGARFTDDGFAMGIAFILKLLNQYEDFDSLHWFTSAQSKLEKDAEISSSTADRVTPVVDSATLNKDAPTMTLTLKRLQKYQTELDLLRYNLSSARIFFQWATVDDGPQEPGSLRSSQQSLNKSLCN